MKTDYRLILENGQKLVVSARNAGEAIEECLRKHRGHYVKKCYAGLTEEDCEQQRKIDGSRKYMAGTVEFEVPNHVAYSDSAQLMNPRARRKDSTLGMFTDGEMNTGRLST